MFFLVSSCSDKDDNEANNQTPNNSPTLQTRVVTVPDAMLDSNEPGAQDAVSFINMANAFTSFAGLMVPPPKIGSMKSTNDGDPWEYTWEFNEGEDVYSITLTVYETETHYEWTMVIDGVLDGIVLSDFVYMEASQTLDGLNGEFTCMILK